MSGEDGRVDLANFLLARIAEDEFDAMQAKLLGGADWLDVVSDNWQTSVGWAQGHVERWSSSRVLIECDAKRRVISGMRHPLADEAGFYVLCLIALPYADHEEFREEWRV